MVEIEKHKFKEKSSEMNIRQRLFEENSIVTFQITTELFPSLVNNQIVWGSVEMKFDTKDIHSLSELEGKIYEGDIGNVTISINNNGSWEHQSVDVFKLSFGKRSMREIEYTLDTDICHLHSVTNIVSLYTTSSSEELLKKHFDMSDFYDVCVEKSIGKSKIRKYFTKEEK